MSVADTKGNSANLRDTRAIYFDVYTKPGSVMIPTSVEIVMPETVIGNGIPAATVCNIKMVYVGMYAVCAQQAFINNVNHNRISYLQRMIRFKNDKAIVKLDSICNSADSSTVIDPIDGLIRFCDYNYLFCLVIV